MKVFWSWQADTHGKTGRHFVREALADAIKLLNPSSRIRLSDAPISASQPLISI